MIRNRTGPPNVAFSEAFEYFDELHAKLVEDSVHSLT